MNNNITFPSTLQYVGSYTSGSLGGPLINATCSGLTKYRGNYFEVYKDDLLNYNTQVQAGITVIHHPNMCH